MTFLDLILTSLQPITQKTTWREAWRIAACRLAILGYVVVVIAVGLVWRYDNSGCRMSFRTAMEVARIMWIKP